LKEGDKNTKFFQRVANSNRRNNIVKSLPVNGSFSTDSTKIRDHIVKFYMQLYSVQYSWRPKMNGLSFQAIGEDEGSWLESEVLLVVKNLNGDKTLGLYGFFSNLLGDVERG
jgi:hypothetical protein